MKRIHNGMDVLPEPHRPWSENRKEAARKRGRRLGQTVNQRDERGWMIPRADTMRRKIYDLMVQGKRGKQIWETLGITHASYVTQRQNIVQSSRQNAMRYNASHDDQVPLPPIQHKKAGTPMIFAERVREACRDEIPDNDHFDQVLEALDAAGFKIAEK